MNMFGIIFCVSLFALFLYTSIDVWISPEKFLEANQRKRAKYYNSLVLFPFLAFGKFFDRHPKVELWYTRIVLALMYLIFILGLIDWFTN